MAEGGCAYRPNPVGLISAAPSGNLPDGGSRPYQAYIVTVLLRQKQLQQ